jgi:hypothetical protein
VKYIWLKTGGKEFALDPEELFRAVEALMKSYAHT